MEKIEEGEGTNMRKRVRRRRRLLKGCIGDELRILGLLERSNMGSGE